MRLHYRLKHVAPKIVNLFYFFSARQVGRRDTALNKNLVIFLKYQPQKGAKDNPVKGLEAKRLSKI